jgi:hypothetical protein
LGVTTMEGETVEKGLEDFVTLADDEIRSKDYYAATVRKPSPGQVHVAVTTKRVILYLWTRETSQVNSVNITDVMGTDIYWSTRRRRKLGIGLLLLGLFGTIVLPSYNSLFLPILLITLPMLTGGVYYIVKKRTSFAIITNIKAATGALSFYSYPKNILEKELSPEKLELEAVPGPDATLMARELGALILNIRKGT